MHIAIFIVELIIRSPMEVDTFVSEEGSVTVDQMGGDWSDEESGVLVSEHQPEEYVSVCVTY